MEKRYNKHERRKYPRYYPDSANLPIVTFLIDGSPKINITVVDIGKGGLMGYTSSIEHFIGMIDHHIQQIEIAFPEQEPFRCSGKILRVLPAIFENRCYCAVEFDIPETLMASDPSVVDSEVEIKHEQLDIPEHHIMTRIEQLENYATIEDIDVETKIRLNAYDSFDDVTSNLTVEEKWLFYEMLDEMMHVAPNYPANLKNAFLNLCRTGLRQNMVLRKKMLIASQPVQN
ncbi:hypothetical protein JW960_22625 [candidate division KSB1 bacterium]|nr:hypothetical protein [candidate division KSB1 bacterium]